MLALPGSHAGRGCAARLRCTGGLALNVVAAVLNRSPLPQTATVSFADVGLGNVSRVAVRSAWGEVGSQRGRAYSCQVPAHGAALLVLEPRE